MSVKKTKIAIAGIGTVGSGVIELIKKNSIQKKFGIEITAIASRRKLNKSGIKLPSINLFNDAERLISFDNYDILVELIGGDNGISKKIVFNALEKGKNVVTANKALVSKYWKKLNEITQRKKSVIKYEAAVAGGIPILKVLNDFLISNKIKKIYGILNGTSNFILTNMLNSNSKFEKILEKAQQLGYAEADPSFDIDGIDTSHKLAILSSLAFNINCDLKSIYVEGIRNIDLIDLIYAKELGYKVKLLGIAQIRQKKLINFVYPCLVHKNELISKVDDVFNGIVVESDFCKKSFFQGEGAGSQPTATSVLSDIIDLSTKELKVKNQSKIKNLKNINITDRTGSFYIRFSTIDQPGVISGITNEFKKNNISMKSMLQKDRISKDKKIATIVVTTHNCNEKDMMKALRKINNLSFVLKKTTFMRIESFK
ncbi:MAG: homoserine dehydrogenase [Rickettsiales bacterium]|nr:homoserine dehydrogenase [Rickettsiales bacterium]|tara:strand:- start:1294 stop:2577 length:1284 start_codon:yes stop_codon:yes gene_type:complete